jgi:hypothetical protein
MWRRIVLYVPDIQRDLFPTHSTVKTKSECIPKHLQAGLPNIIHRVTPTKTLIVLCKQAVYPESETIGENITETGDDVARKV